MKGRFAPSPTGRMHLGNIYCALLSWLSARSQGGAWLLRIEDLDPQRSRRDYAAQIEDDLLWLGLDWDEGGSHGGPQGSYYQSDRSDLYLHYLRLLWLKGIVYPCHCTRADIMATQAPHESDGRVVYAGTCRPSRLVAAAAAHLSSVTASTSGAIAPGCTAVPDATTSPSVATVPDGSPSGPLPSGEKLRLFVPDEEVSFVDAHYGPQSVNLATHCGDFILRRADGAWAYQLAVVVDDALMGVTEVVRGRDLLLSTPQQIYLQSLLGFSSPRYCHHPMLNNDNAQRLCKRDKSLDMGELRKRFSPQELIGYLASLMGIIDRPEPVSARQLVSLFDWNKVPTHDICVPKDILKV